MNGENGTEDDDDRRGELKATNHMVLEQKIKIENNEQHATLLKQHLSFLERFGALVQLRGNRSTARRLHTSQT